MQITIEKLTEIAKAIGDPHTARVSRVVIPVIEAQEFRELVFERCEVPEGFRWKTTTPIEVII